MGGKLFSGILLFACLTSCRSNPTFQTYLTNDNYKYWQIFNNEKDKKSKTIYYFNNKGQWFIYIINVNGQIEKFDINDIVLQSNWKLVGDSIIDIGGRNYKIEKLSDKEFVYRFEDKTKTQLIAVTDSATSILNHAIEIINKKRNYNSLIAASDSVYLNQDIEDSIKVFLKNDSCQSCFHQLFIDKVRPNYTILTIRSRPYSDQYLKNNKPIFKTHIGSTDFYIYCGIEDVFNFHLKKSEFEVYDSLSTTFKTWGLHIKGDSTWWDKNQDIPFFPSSN